MAEAKGTFLPEDVTLLLEDITGKIEPKPTKERERLIQSGVHYSEMLPLEQSSSRLYLEEYYRAIEDFGRETAMAVASVSKIVALNNESVVLVSLARAGTPVGVLIKRRLKKRYGIDASHYAVSIVRGRGIDKNAMRRILDAHPAKDIQFVDGWTGKGAILGELLPAAREFIGEKDPRRLLAVLADPANITDLCGTHQDIPIASAFLNSTVCGLMSRTIIRPGINKGELHGVAIFDELRHEDRTYEFIGAIERHLDSLDEMSSMDEMSEMNGIDELDETQAIEQPSAFCWQGIDEVREIARNFGVKDINFVKPGIGETTRVLLRRVPDIILLADDATEKYVAHLALLAKERGVALMRYPLKHYKACGIIRALGADV